MINTAYSSPSSLLGKYAIAMQILLAPTPRGNYITFFLPRSKKETLTQKLCQFSSS